MVGDRICYLDASAVIKLVITEAESRALRAFLADQPRRAASRLVGVEAARALSRLGISGGQELTDVLAHLDQIDVTEDVLREASRLPPPSLRTLDAIHLATALALRPDLEALVTYDRRLADAATAAGLPVVAPS